MSVGEPNRTALRAPPSSPVLRWACGSHVATLTLTRSLGVALRLFPPISLQYQQPCGPASRAVPIPLSDARVSHSGGKTLPKDTPPYRPPLPRRTSLRTSTRKAIESESSAPLCRFTRWTGRKSWASPACKATALSAPLPLRHTFPAPLPRIFVFRFSSALK